MNQARVEKVIQALQRAQMETNKVAMDEIMVSSCGSPACHAGHYAIGKYLLGESESYPAIFVSGVWEMAEDLKVATVSSWAAKHPEIWGNDYGERVFSHSEAFGIPSGEEITLDDIISHWKGVRDRLED